MKARNIVIVLFVVGLLNLLAYLFVIRVDMTDDKHYSLSEASIELLRKTEASIDITLFLQGDLNAGFERLQRATKETIEEMSVHSDIHFSIEDLQSSYSKEEAERMGMRPIVIHEREQDGKTAQTTIYPYALIQYNGKKAVVALLKNTRGLSGEENLNASIEQIE
ncbi:MAG: GldG family protein, partial [Paludibacteraceae bacterium]|nr:GldG family protein [Paludibacteraceae bacterium]